MSRITLTRYLVEKQRERGLISAELRLLLEVCARACKSIATAVGKGALAGVLGGRELAIAMVCMGVVVVLVVLLWRRRMMKKGGGDGLTR